MTSNASQSFYELYRNSSDSRISPQLAMKILSTFDRAVTETLQRDVRSKLHFKGYRGWYGQVDDVWTFLIKDVTFKMHNGAEIVHADKIKIVSCNSKRAGDNS